MNIEEFREQTRSSLEEALNQLHTATLLVNHLESQIMEAGRTVQRLSAVVEEFLDSQAVDLPHEDPAASEE